MSDLSLMEAFRIATEVHGNQRDKAGEPYLFHVMRVAMQMDSDEERVVAILHDALEDGGEVWLIQINNAYGKSVLRAIHALTRRDCARIERATGQRVDFREPYLDYIRRLSANPLAVKVKFADLRDNLREDRLRKLPTETAERLRVKYRNAFDLLYAIEAERESAAIWQQPIPSESPDSSPPASSS